MNPKNKATVSPDAQHLRPSQFAGMVEWCKLLGGDNSGAVAMRTVLFSILLVFVTNVAHAQTADLTCGGAMHQYQPKHIEGNIAPGTTHIDLGLKTIETPVGSFEVSRVDGVGLTFKGTQNNLMVFGTLDRTSGEMRVFWRTPEEEAKVQAGVSANNWMYAEMRCSAAKRLF